MKSFCGGLAAACLAVVAFASAGCARMASVSTLDGEGGVQRSITLAVNKGMGGEKVDPKKFLTFPAPASWKVDTKETESEVNVTASRTLAPDPESRLDLVMGDAGDGKAECRIRAVKLPNGSIEYTETWTWTGGRKSVVPGPIDEKAKETFTKVLEPLGASPAQVELTAKEMERVVRRTMLGPGSPLLGELLVNQNAGVRKLRAALWRGMVDHLAVAFPSQPEEKRKEAATLFATLLSKGLEEKQDKAQESGPGENSGQLVAIEAAVAGLGRVVETNGEVDPVDGRVYWSMFLEACQEEPVTLRAVFAPAAR